MSLVDTIEKMPDSMTEEKQRLIEIYKEYADALIKYQDPATGMWYQVVDRGGIKLSIKVIWKEIILRQAVLWQSLTQL